MNELPLNWAWARVGDLVDFGPKNYYVEETEAGFVPLQHLGVNYRSRHTFEVRSWGAIKKGYTHFADGDVLLARITPSFENGKAGIVRGLPNGIGAGSTEYFVCRPIPGVVLPEYLLAHFKTPQFLRDGEQVMSGAVGQQRVPKQYLLDSQLPLAPLNEQKRIADKLDAIVARVNACRERLERIPAILKRFRQAVLTAATSGKLTDEWRTEHELNDNWVTCNIQSVARIGTGSTPLRSNSSFYSSSGIPWITSAATAKPIVKSAEEFVTSAAITAHRLKMYPVGTLLVAMYGEGKTRGQVTELGIAATINQACAAIVVDETRANKNFVKLALQANYMEMRELAEGGNQPNLNLSKIKEFPLYLPSLDEQAEIVRRVEALFAYADRLDARYAAARARVEKLTPALLAKAFRGELVPQDPNDEPASVLLERIKLMRTKNEAKPKRGRNKANHAAAGN
ncbi:restriction endonuclease subunit S [Nitrosomonas communis]|uniref:Type I restriction enzyme, S subunit n=1 Tax=Nitrosomonas communis TaxID=44574 RepID=A0A1H2UWU0_9PROT|nr:restriction endonuclease subunit S [Nitrosomonas communis]SDW60562.1 type I restriction enzyme, S subunit [Nitrosomonas communis]